MRREVWASFGRLPFFTSSKNSMPQFLSGVYRVPGFFFQPSNACFVKLFVRQVMKLETHFLPFLVMFMSRLLGSVQILLDNRRCSRTAN